ncbi:MAG: EamA family transporter [Chloroflexi bacterium]|nr:EamA family transporter [Chloroflexota bacterium]
MIEWLVPAIGSPATFSVVTFGDKAILSRFGLSSSSLTLFVGLNQALFGTVVLLFAPLEGVGWSGVTGGVGAGVFQGLGLILMFYVLKREEASRVIPVFQTSPIFVALLASAFLDESLSVIQWAAVFMAVIGAIAASTTKSSIGGSFRPKPIFAVLILAAASVAVSQIFLEISTDEMSVWNTVSLRGWGMAAVMSVAFARKTNLRELKDFLRVPKQGGLLALTEGTLAVAASLQLIYAISRGPVSLVAAIFGTRPGFMFIIGLVGSKVYPSFFDEVFNRTDFLIKFGATALIVTAIVLIATG